MKRSPVYSASYSEASSGVVSLVRAPVRGIKLVLFVRTRKTVITTYTRKEGSIKKNSLGYLYQSYFGRGIGIIIFTLLRLVTVN